MGKTLGQVRELFKLDGNKIYQPEKMCLPNIPIMSIFKGCLRPQKKMIFQNFNFLDLKLIKIPHFVIYKQSCAAHLAIKIPCKQRGGNSIG